MILTPEQALQVAIAQHRAGQLVAAEATCRRILAASPNHAETLRWLGLAALGSARYAEAVEWFSRAIAQAPGRADYFSDLGAAWCHLGQHAEALTALQRAVSLDGGSANTHLNLSNALLGLGRLDEAIASCRRALELQPSCAGAHHNLGLAWMAKGQHAEAATCFVRALAIEPGYIEAENNLGNALWEMGRLDEATTHYRRAIELAPGYAPAHCNLANVLARKCDWEPALAAYARAIELQPDFAQAHCNLANTLWELGRHGDAIASFQRAIQIAPDYAEAHDSLGVAYRSIGGNELAAASYRRAIACRPDFAAAHWNLALVLLLMGRFEEGWREYEWRRVSPEMAIAPRDLQAPQWTGERAPGRTLFIHAEQGFGDTIHFLRYVPLVRERSGAARVVLECAPELVRLFVQSGDWNADIVARGQRAEASESPDDLHVPLLSLPLTLKMFEPLAMSAPYLRAERRRLFEDATRAENTRALRIGLAWAGSTRHKNDRLRTIAPEKLAPILRVPGASFFSLQLPPSHNPNVSDLTAHITDFADTAALMMELDLIISADTATAHLAGALGRRVWTLLPFAADWRWGIGREDTPWYPTMRLSRQGAPGDWDSAIARIADELSTMTQ